MSAGIVFGGDMAGDGSGGESGGESGAAVMTALSGMINRYWCSSRSKMNDSFSSGSLTSSCIKRASSSERDTVHGVTLLLLPSPSPRVRVLSEARIDAVAGEKVGDGDADDDDEEEEEPADVEWYRTEITFLKKVASHIGSMMMCCESVHVLPWKARISPHSWKRSVTLVIASAEMPYCANHSQYVCHDTIGGRSTLRCATMYLRSSKCERGTVTCVETALATCTSLA